MVRAIHYKRHALIGGKGDPVAAERSRLCRFLKKLGQHPESNKAGVALFPSGQCGVTAGKPHSFCSRPAAVLVVYCRDFDKKTDSPLTLITLYEVGSVIPWRALTMAMTVTCIAPSTVRVEDACLIQETTPLPALD
jgi:hypothetical protein